MPAAARRRDRIGRSARCHQRPATGTTAASDHHATPARRIDARSRRRSPARGPSATGGTAPASHQQRDAQRGPVEQQPRDVRPARRLPFRDLARHLRVGRQPDGVRPDGRPERRHARGGRPRRAATRSVRCGRSTRSWRSSSQARPRTSGPRKKLPWTFAQTSTRTGHRPEPTRMGATIRDQQQHDREERHPDQLRPQRERDRRDHEGRQRQPRRAAQPEPASPSDLEQATEDDRDEHRPEQDQAGPAADLEDRGEQDLRAPLLVGPRQARRRERPGVDGRDRASREISAPARSWYARSTLGRVAMSAPSVGSATARNAQRRGSHARMLPGGGCRGSGLGQSGWAEQSRRGLVPAGIDSGAGTRRPSSDTNENVVRTKPNDLSAFRGGSACLEPSGNRSRARPQPRARARARGPRRATFPRPPPPGPRTGG